MMTALTTAPIIAGTRLRLTAEEMSADSITTQLRNTMYWTMLERGGRRRMSVRSASPAVCAPKAQAAAAANGARKTGFRPAAAAKRDAARERTQDHSRGGEPR